MAMFDYKDYSSEDSAKLVSDASRLAAYTNAATFFGFIPGADALNGLSTATGHMFDNPVNIGIPDGWVELTPADLGVSESLVDREGYFQIDSLYTGNVTGGPQAKIFAQHNDAGEVVRVNLNITGTNNLVDVIDYLNLNSREGVELFEPILAIVKDYAIKNGLEGSDVLISGYSLGAAVTNVLAAERQQLADGFFTDSDYIAFEVPTIYNNPDVVLNVGYENDVVHRITGDEAAFGDAVLAMDPLFINPDKNFSSSIDNTILFDDMYASPLWNLSPFSILNIPSGWYAHVHGVTTDANQRIIDSKFYEYTHKDSTVVVSGLSVLSRDTTWVSDKFSITSDHYGSSAFLIGTLYGDLIAGGKNSDYIDAGMGDDTIRVGHGADHVDGGFGLDEVRIAGRSQDWDVFKTQDDTLFFVDKDGVNFVEAESVESVSFDNEIISHRYNYQITDTGLVETRPLKWFGSKDKTFGEHTEGTETGEFLSGSTIFARDGDDFVFGQKTSDLLHGGEGKDMLVGYAGDDRLYGAEGDDLLVGGVGNDDLIGGLGNDTFWIDKQSSSDVIHDFNNDIGYTDVIQFARSLFSDVGELSSKTYQAANDVLVTINDTDYLTVLNANIDDVLNNSVII